MIPASRLSATATCVVADSPSNSMSTKPATRAPPMAPKVLALYNRPMCAPAVRIDVTRWRVSRGSVRPMRNVTGVTAASVRSSRIRVSWPADVVS